MKNTILLCLSCICVFSKSIAQLTGAQLLDKAIQYHDPNDTWNKHENDMFILESRPDGRIDTAILNINIQKSYFKYTSKGILGERIYEVLKDTCNLAYNNSEIIPDSIVKKYKMNCDFAPTIRNYYTYLWGLPMKLKDPGTLINPKVEEVEFNGLICYQLKVVYEESIGKDIWYFYFKKSDYSLYGYKFHRDESKNDGEYITLEGEVQIRDMKIPQTRKWYYNKNEEFLGEDKLMSASYIPK